MPFVASKLSVVVGFISEEGPARGGALEADGRDEEPSPGALDAAALEQGHAGPVEPDGQEALAAQLVASTVQASCLHTRARARAHTHTQVGEHAGALANTRHILQGFGT